MEKELLKDFLSWYGEEQITTEHGLNNPYHMENILLTHTLLVYDNMRRYLDKYSSKHSDNEVKILLLASLLHDIGKPYTREVKDGKVTFPNHHFLSSLRALDFAKNYIKEPEDLLKLAVVIFYHTVAHGSLKLLEHLPNDIQRLSAVLGFADKKGRLVNHDVVKSISFPKIKKRKVTTDKKLILLHGPTMGGKTAYAKKLKQELNGYLLSMDIAKQQAKQQKLNKEELFNKMKEEAKNHDIIIVDMSNLTLVSRYNFITLYPNRHTELHMLFRSYNDIKKKLLKIKDSTYVGDPITYLSTILRPSVTPTSEEAYDKVRLILTEYNDQDNVLTIL